MAFRRISTLFASLAMALLATGCANLKPMALKDDVEKVDLAKPMFLMTMKVKNAYKERWQPRVLSLQVQKENGAAGKPELLAFQMDAKGTVQSTDGNGNATYLLRFVLDTGPHTITAAPLMASAFPVHGFYTAPLHTPVPAVPGGVYYLGSVDAVIRERTGNEFRAGPPIPLIDQAVAGASGGTFDIVISDRFDTDVATFKKSFPALKDVEIKKSVLPPWDRAKAQLMWEKS